MHWLVVTSPENFARTSRLGFTVQGFKRRHRRKLGRMAAGDVLAYYLIREGSFAATCRVTSLVFEAHTRIWSSPGHPDEVYPWRVHIEADLLVPEASRPRASELADRLQFVARWPRRHWRLAFQGMLHELPATDGTLIRRALELSMAEGKKGRRV